MRPGPADILPPMSTDQSPDRDGNAEAGSWHGYPYPASGVPAPEIPSQQPPYPPAAQPAYPISGAPGQSPGTAQTSGPPQTWSVADPTWPDPIDSDPNRWGPRITPTPPKPKSRLVVGLLAGLVAGIVIAGPTAYFLAPSDSKPTVTPTASPSAANSAPVGPFEQNQLALNRPKFHDDLATLAASWLPFVSNCLTDQEKGGPKLGVDEKAHVTCRYGNVFVHFAQFKSALDRDHAREYRQRLNAEGRTIAPGAVDPVRKPRTSDPAEGTYIEYALVGPDKHPTAGIWWDSGDGKAVAVYMEASWDPILGKSWEPLRDLWQRHS